MASPLQVTFVMVGKGSIIKDEVMVTVVSAVHPLSSVVVTLHGDNRIMDDECMMNASDSSDDGMNRYEWYKNGNSKKPDILTDRSVCVRWGIEDNTLCHERCAHHR